MITATDVWKSYGDTIALRGVSLEVPDGTCLGLVGPNGAGKTTLFNILAGVLDSDRGSITVATKDGQRGPGFQGAMLEASAVFDLLTGREQLEWICDVVGVAPKLSSDRIAELSKALDLAPWLDRSIVEYSRGIRKKISLASALITDPRVLILDEPFEGTDVPGVRTMKSILSQFQAAGATIVVSSHVLPLLEDLCDEFALIAQGQILATGDVETLAKTRRHLPHMDDLLVVDLESVYMGIVDPEHQTQPLRTLASVDGG